jgi:hypothetical protein
MTPNDKIAKILFECRKEPLKFFRDVLNVKKLDPQQIQLINSAVIPGCRTMVKSARGTGKTFVISGLDLFFLLCFDDVNVRVLSPSEQQLKTVFMREINKHYGNMHPEFRKFYDIKSMSIYLTDPKSINESHCVTASPERPENVSGVHAGKQVYLLDEASGIISAIYGIIVGSLGTAAGGDHLIGVSNPNRDLKGGFYSDLFSKKPEGWELLTFTAKNCHMISSQWIKDMEDLYGLDGDEYRVSVLGEFPRADGSSFIPEAIVEEASSRTISHRDYYNHPIVMGVDIARSLSGDKSVFCLRQGPKVIEVIAFKTDNTMEIVAKLKDIYRSYPIAVAFGDATGVGGPVLDRARQLGINIVDVVAANKSRDPLQYANVRTELWGEMREWLQFGSIPEHYELKKELSTMTWGYSGKMQMQLTSKKQLRSKGLDSPDHSDALSYTFYKSNHTLKRFNTQPRAIRPARVLWA